MVLDTIKSIYRKTKNLSIREIYLSVKVKFYLVSRKMQKVKKQKKFENSMTKTTTQNETDHF